MTPARPAPAVLAAVAAATCLFAAAPAGGQVLPAVPALPTPGMRNPETAGPDGPLPGPGFSLRTFTDADGPHRYSLFVPKTPPPPAGYPVVLFLHGANERGTDGVAPTKVGLGPIAAADPDFPAVIVFPQVENRDGRILPAWNPDRPAGRRALKILEEVEAALPTDADRRVLAGWSMGGYGVLGQLAGGDPTRWSAAVSVASGRYEEVDRKALAAATRVTPLWIVAGANDRFVPFVETEETVRELREDGGRVRFTKVRNAGHSVWETVFASDRFAAILRNPRVVAPRQANGGPGEADGVVADLPDEDEFDRSPAAAAAPPAEFDPDLTLRRGAFVRADEALMTKLVRQAVDALPPDTLTGTVPNQTITREVLGHTVVVNFCGIAYAGRISDASVRTHPGNRVTVRVEVVDARLTVQVIRLRAPLGHRGVAGPVTIRAGLRRPLALEVDVRPSVEDGKLKLAPLAVRFALPADDYYVQGPGYVDEDGLFLTEGKLAKTLVEGLYEARTQGEQAVRDAVPAAVRDLGDIPLGDPGSLAGQVLPLPLIEPTVGVKLNDVRADGDGLTALFDLTVNSSEAMSAGGPKRFDGGVSLDLAAGYSRPEELAVGVSTELLRILSGELVAGGVPRIDARDVPGDPLAALSDPANLRRIVPALAGPEYAGNELRARLTLAGPLAAYGANSDDTAVVRIDSDAVELTVDRRPGGGPDNEAGTGPWERAATVRLSLRQPVRATVRKNGAYRNFVALAEGEDGRIGALSAESAVGGPVDADLAAELLQEGWANWLADEGPFSGPLEDFELAGAGLRIEGFASRAPSPGVSGGLLLARFMVPDTSLENRSDLPLTYRVRNAAGGPWGGPFTVGPGETHTYKTREPLRFEQLGPAAGGSSRSALRRTLKAGQCYHYHVPVGAVVPVLDDGDHYHPADDVLLNRHDGNDPRPWRLRAPVAGREFPTLSAAPAPRGGAAPPRPAVRRTTSRPRSPGRN